MGNKLAKENVWWAEDYNALSEAFVNELLENYQKELNVQRRFDLVSDLEFREWQRKFGSGSLNRVTLNNHPYLG